MALIAKKLRDQSKTVPMKHLNIDFQGISLKKFQSSQRVSGSSTSKTRFL